jgi:hypothetical protein
MERPTELTPEETNQRQLIERITIQFIDKDEATFDSAVVMVAAHVEGPDVERIARVTAYPSEFIDQIGVRLTESGLWKNDRTDYQEWDPTTDIGMIRFTMDHLVALGKLRRTGIKKNGRYEYEAVAITGLVN